MAQQQRHGNEGRQFGRAGDITITPSEVATPDRVFCVEADVRQQQQASRNHVRFDAAAETLPRQHTDEDRQQQQRIEEEDGLFRLEQRAKKADVKRQFPRIIRRQRRIQHPRFAREHRDVGIEERSKTFVLIPAIDQQKERINRHSRFGIDDGALPQSAAAHIVEPQHQQQKHAASQQIQASRETRQQVQSEGSRANQQRAAAASKQPFILKRQASQRQKHDVVVLHHVLRIVQVRGAKQQRHHARDRLPRAEPQQPQKTETHQRGQHVDQYVGAVADHDAAHTRINAVVREHRQLLQLRPNDVGGQHQQRLPNAIPAVQLAAASVYPELGILVGEDLRLVGPEPRRRLQAVRGVGGAEFSRLDNKRAQARRQG